MITALFSYYIIPFLTLHLARGTGYFTTNFSCIRSDQGRHLEFLLWCSVTGIYFFSSLSLLCRRILPTRKGRQLPGLSAALFLLSALLPYLPEQYPTLSFLHLICAFLSSVLLFFCLLLLSLRLYDLRPSLGRTALCLLIMAVCFCLGAWIWSGIINTAMEICLVLTACLLIRRFSLF
ncbi:MAG: hypothetical protein SPF91_04785 [Clostridium sp.]|nr:hypothetical protein [Clostridiaceae bacterium]MDD6073061.1 hypothetical protein [Clostridium sp.]MDY5483495.1 hypothetical protein [Clostridium sp.]